MTLRSAAWGVVLSVLSLSATPQPNAVARTAQQAGSQQSGINIDELGHDLGEENAPNWIAEFLDLGCGYCARFAAETYPALDNDYVATGKIRWKFIPFVTGLFPHSEDAAVAAECAADQGKFKAMHDSLLAARKEWMQSASPQGVFTRVAKRLALDQAAFARCSMGNEARLRVRRQTMVAQQVNIRGTPTFFINGRRIEGAIPLALFRRVLAENTR
ncbi:MAG: thioredoxin domain-containing protein [Gemmatimonadaceae bacterium]